MSVLILAVLSVGATQLLCQAQTDLNRQAQRRTALELAGARIEALRASSYASVCPVGSNSGCFLAGDTGAWTQSVNDPGEIVNVLGTRHRITTRVDGMDVDGVAPWLDCLRVSVTVTPLATGSLPVMLATLQARLDN